MGKIKVTEIYKKAFGVLICIPEAGIVVLVISLKHGKLAEIINISIPKFHKIPMIC